MMLYNRNPRTLYKKSCSFVMMIWMCIVGYAKMPFLIYALYTYKRPYYQQDDDPYFDYSFDGNFLDHLTLEFFGGVGISVLFFIKFDYRWSRRLVILITEMSYVLGLQMLNWNIQYANIPLGFTTSLSMVIYPLYLYEQSYESEFANLSNYLQFSFFFGALFVQLCDLTFTGDNIITSQQFFIGLSIISAVNGLLINYSIGIKETVLCEYMRDRIPSGNVIINKLLKYDHQRIQNYFLSERQRKQLLNGYAPINGNPQMQSLQQLKKNQVKKNLKMLLFTFLIPFTQIFLLEMIYESSYYLKSDDSYGNLAITPSISLIFAVLAQILCFFVNHTYLLKRGFQLSFFISVICLIEYLIQDNHYTTFQKYVNLVLLVVVFCTITSVWRVRIFSNINLKMIWIHQIVFWLSFFLFFINTNYMGILIAQLITFFVGYLLVNFN